MRGAAQELTGELDWPPADSELAERLGVTVDDQLAAGRGPQLVRPRCFARAWEYRTVQISALRQYFRTPADVSARRLSVDIPGVYLRRARVLESARCGVGRRRGMAGQVHRGYNTGISADHGIGMVAGR